MGRGGPRNPADAERLALENIIGAVASALDHVRCAEDRIRHRALTEYDKQNLIEVLRAKRDLEEIKAGLCDFHPNRLEKQ